MINDIDEAITQIEQTSGDPVAKAYVIKGLEMARSILEYRLRPPRQAFVFKENVEFYDSEIKGADYNRDLQIMRVRFVGGGTRTHFRVPMFYWDRFKDVDEPGDFYAVHICTFPRYLKEVA